MSGTVWDRQDVPTMWSSAQAADTQMAWQQAAAWQRTYDLLYHQESRLRACRDELTAAWPPDRSPAAQGFVAYLDNLLSSISAAKENALANRSGLVGVLSSLSSAKVDMAKLAARWDGYEAESQNRAQNLVNTSEHSGGANWREELNREARARMSRNDQEVLEATGQMIAPEPLLGRSVDQWTSIYPEPSLSSESASPMKTSVGVRVQDQGGWVRAPVVTSAGEIDETLGLAALVPSGTATQPLSLNTPQLGLGVTLAGDPLVSPAAVAGRQPVSRAGQRPRSNEPAATASALPQSIGRSATALPQRFGRSGVASAPMTNGRRGVAAVPPQSAQSNPMDARKINPVGGTIGSPSAMHPQTGMPIGVGGRSAGRIERSPDLESWYQWETAEGGPSVLVPLTEQQNDPGRGVFGIDR